MAPSQTFQDHVREFKRRIIWVVGTIGISAGIAYAVRLKVTALLQKPLGAPLFYSSPSGGFSFVLKLSMVIGMFITLPVIIYQLLRFIEPALPIRIKASTMLKIIGASTFLAAAGIAFGYLYMIPQSLHFFGSFSTAQIKPLISADSYLSYVINNLVTFALAFQIPLLVLFINWIKPLKPGKLLKYQRHVIVGSFGLALILPFTYDPISQFMVAVPIIGLYYISVILLLFANRGRRRAPATFNIQPAPAVKPAALLESAPLAGSPSPGHLPLAAFNSTLTKSRLSLDGMRSGASSFRPQTAYTRVAAKPTIKQAVAKPRSLPAPSYKPRGFSTDGFFLPSTPFS
ncbi:MAG: twin-arginine translocase subunit TatC [Candidatus Saccharimonadales bacterium]